MERNGAAAPFLFSPGSVPGGVGDVVRPGRIRGVVDGLPGHIPGVLRRVVGSPEHILPGLPDVPAQPGGVGPGPVFLPVEAGHPALLIGGVIPVGQRASGLVLILNGLAVLRLRPAAGRGAGSGSPRELIGCRLPNWRTRD